MDGVHARVRNSKRPPPLPSPPPSPRPRTPSLIFCAPYRNVSHHTTPHGMFSRTLITIIITTTQVAIGTDRFRVPELLVNTSPLTDALSGGDGEGHSPSPGLRALAESLTRPGFVICPIQVK